MLHGSPIERSNMYRPYPNLHLPYVFSDTSCGFKAIKGSQRIHSEKGQLFQLSLCIFRGFRLGDWRHGSILLLVGKCINGHPLVPKTCWCSVENENWNEPFWDSRIKETMGHGQKCCSWGHSNSHSLPISHQEQQIATYSPIN